jgi:hypothetical protein
MATVHKIELYDVVELLEPTGGAPSGAQGTVIHFLHDDTVAEIEITKPVLEGLDSIVYAPLSNLRRVGKLSGSTGAPPR